MLPFERQVVAALIQTTDPHVRAQVVEFVDGTLRVMPEHLRAGVAVESLALGAWDRLRSWTVGEPGAELTALLEASRVPPVRQYVRLFRSLVLFAEQELSDHEPASAP